MAFTLAAFIGAEGVGWVASAIGILCLFERRSPVLSAIDAGYFTVAFTAMGAIIGALQ